MQWVTIYSCGIGSDNVNNEGPDSAASLETDRM